LIEAPQVAAKAEGGSRVAVLDGLRAVAILAVMAFHYGVRWTPPHSDTDLYPYHGFFGHLPIVTPVLNYGWAGVELFFVISGFVICMTLERCTTVWDFARRRLARLWPAMLVCAAITMAVAQFGPDQWRVGGFSFLSSILFIEPSLFGDWFGVDDLGWVDGVYWTLWIEVRFYIMAAILFALFRKRFLPALTALTVISFVAGVRMLEYPHRDVAWLLLLPTFLPYFTFGAGLYRFNILRKLTFEAASAMLISTLIIFAQGWLSFDYPAGGPIGFAVVNALILMAFILFALGSPLVRPFGWRPLAKLGEASYSLYLIHSVVGIVLIELLSKVIPWPLAILLVTAAMIALSLALFRWVEGPGKRLILRLTSLTRADFKAVLRFSKPAFLRRAASESLPSTLPNG
jgi:peptidoglycan/LPS O-acetylase OafA/YrhL